MRLLQFYIQKYRVLNDLNIDFDRKKVGGLDTQQGYSLDFLAGVNGTGKSTVLHLLGRIFAQLLTKNYYFPVLITLTYTLQDNTGQSHKVTISNTPEEDNDKLNYTLRYKVDDGEWESGTVLPDFLPRQIVIYTTGSELAWLDELSQNKERDTALAGVIKEVDETDAYLRELADHKEMGLDDENLNINFDNPLLFIQSERLPLVALCGLLASRKYQKDHTSSEKEILHDALEAISLDNLASFSLRIRSQRGLTERNQQIVIDKLVKIADHRVRRGADLLLVFDLQAQLKKYLVDIQSPSTEEAKSVFAIYDSPIALFQRLNYLYEHLPHYDSPLQEVSLFFKRQVNISNVNHTLDEPMLQLYDWLSDGEQSFLGRMALFALFRASNMLIMLDEPEVHFNDVWKREIVNMLDKIMTGHASHALITTHSSIALTDVRREDILVLRRQQFSTGGEDASGPPNIETLGADPSDILVHVFGTRSATGARSVRFIRQQIAQSNTKEALEQLESIVAPGYWRYRIRLEMERLQ